MRPWEIEGFECLEYSQHFGEVKLVPFGLYGGVEDSVVLGEGGLLVVFGDCGGLEWLRGFGNACCSLGVRVLEMP